MGYDRVSLKLNVKRTMKGTRPRPMLVTLVFSLIIFVVGLIINSVMGALGLSGLAAAGLEWDAALSDLFRSVGPWGVADDILSSALDELFRNIGLADVAAAMAGGLLLGMASYLWNSVMDVGYEGYCLSMVREENPPLSKVFCVFSRIGPAVLTRLLAGVFLVLWSLLVLLGWYMALLAVVALAIAADLEFLLGLLMMVSMPALWLCVAWVMLRYALVDYVLLDKGLSGLDAIREGRRLMKGRFKKALVLQLSFFGWFLLLILLVYWGLIALGVAFLVYLYSMGTSNGAGVALLLAAAALIGALYLWLWLRPYTVGAMARFYDWAKADADGPRPAPGPAPGPGGWSGPTDYTWSSGPTSGTGTGAGTGMGTGMERPGSSGGVPTPPPAPPAPPWPRNPKPPKDDPWD